MDNNGRPTMLPPIYRNIPKEMQERRQWVNWKLEESHSPNGKPYTKVPLNATKGGKASTTRPWTWATLATAKDRHDRYSAQAGRGEVQGAGYVLQHGEVGIDLDKCRDPDTGTIAEWATAIIERINSYTEVSPSGTGIRIICKGELPAGARRKGPVEMYDESSPRYLTITGHHIEGTAENVENRQAEIESVHADHLGREVGKAHSPAAAGECARDYVDDLEVADVLEVASRASNGGKFTKLWRGDWQNDYPSQSEADLALSSLLAFYCGPQPDLIDAFFRQSGLMRDKWERGDYRERIIDKAIDKGEFYDWGRVDDGDLESIVKAVAGEPAEPTEPGEPKDKAKDQPKDDNARLYEQSEAKSKEKRRRRIYTIDELAAMPPPQWHIKGIFPRKSIVILWGAPGTGKSFLALDWGLCTATGKTWMGRAVHQGPVVYIAAEGVSGISKRCLRWCEHHQVTPPTTFGIIPEAFALIQQEELKALAECIKEQMSEAPALIVIDTLNRNIGGSESSEDDMGAFIRSAELLQRAFDATILIIHHTGWNIERERGHSSLRGAADTMVSVAKMGERVTDGIEIACVKQKDGDEFDKMAVACIQVGNGDTASVVLTEEMDLGAINTERMQREEDAQIIQVLKHVPDDPYLAIKVDEVAKLAQLTEYRCRRLLDRAFNAHYVSRVGLGTKGSAWTFYLTNNGKDLVSTNAVIGLLGD